MLFGQMSFLSGVCVCVCHHTSTLQNDLIQRPKCDCCCLPSRWKGIWTNDNVTRCFLSYTRWGPTLLFFRSKLIDLCKSQYNCSRCLFFTKSSYERLCLFHFYLDDSTHGTFDDIPIEKINNIIKFKYLKKKWHLFLLHNILWLNK